MGYAGAYPTSAPSASGGVAYDVGGGHGSDSKVRLGPIPYGGL
jgi:hypothetical protein